MDLPKSRIAFACPVVHLPESENRTSAGPNVRQRADERAFVYPVETSNSAGQGGPSRSNAQNPDGVPTPIRKLVPHVPAPSRDHREDEPTTLLEQNVVDARVVHADLVGRVSNVKLDGATAARLEVDEEQAFCGAQEVPGMRLSVQQLVHVHAPADCLAGGLERVE